MTSNRIFTISEGISKVIKAFDDNEPENLIPEMGIEAVNILKKWWHGYELTTVKFTGDIWAHRGKDTILNEAEKLSLGTGKSVLDLGCGIGGPARILSKNYRCKVTGIDINKEAVIVGNALTRLENLEEYVSLFFGDRKNTSFSDESFDIVWEHAGFGTEDETLNTWKESFRVLKYGGKLITRGKTDLLEKVSDIGFKSFCFYPYLKDEKAKLMMYFISELKKNEDEIINRTSKENFELWYNQKVKSYEKFDSIPFKPGLFIAVK